MKLIAILLSLCLSFNVLATENVVSAFEAELDSFQYALTVEWDQIDQTFADQETEKFFRTMDSFMARGLNTADMLTVLEKRISDKDALAMLKVKLSHAATASNQEELLQIIREASSNTGFRGASWNGTAVAFYGGIGILVVTFVAYTTWYNSKYECAEWSTEGRHNVCVRYEER